MTNVVQFVPAPPGGPRSLRRRTYASKDPRSSCRHDQLEYDPNARTVECVHCGADVDPFKARDLLAPPPAPWGVAQGVHIEPLAERLEPWGWKTAERAFLDAFDHLTNASILRDPAGLHYHHCPECYEKAPCVMLCTVEGDLSGDGVDFGHHAVCDECQREAHAAAERIRASERPALWWDLAARAWVEGKP